MAFDSKLSTGMPSLERYIYCTSDFFFTIFGLIVTSTFDLLSPTAPTL